MTATGTKRRFQHLGGDVGRSSQSRHTHQSDGGLFHGDQRDLRRHFLSGRITLAGIFVLKGSNYLFKMFVAFADTLPFYYLTRKLSDYLQINTKLVMD